MACYCANYYGSINCHNTVSKFGDRCALCQSNGTRPTTQVNGDLQWVENVQREQLRREEEKARRERVSRTSSGRIR